MKLRQIQKQDDEASLLFALHYQCGGREAMMLQRKQDLHKKALKIVFNVSLDTESASKENHFNLFQSQGKKQQSSGMS